MISRRGHVGDRSVAPPRALRFSWRYVLTPPTFPGAHRRPIFATTPCAPPRASRALPPASLASLTELR